MPKLPRNLMFALVVATLVGIGLLSHFRRPPPAAEPMVEPGADPASPPAGSVARDRPAAPPPPPFAEVGEATVDEGDDDDLQTLDVQKLLEVAMDYWDDPEYCLAAALLSPARLAWLEEAARRHPQEPRIQLAVIANWLSIGSQDPELLGWLEAFRQAAPDNALADYLAAGYWLRLERPDLAVELLQQAMTKSTADSYAIAICDSLHKFATTAGLNETSAAATLLSLPLPHIGELRRTSQALNEMARNLADAGDQQSATELANLLLGMGATLQRSAANSMIIEELLAISIQQQALLLLRENTSADASAQTATIDAQIDALRQRRLDIRQATAGWSAVSGAADNATIASYLEDVRRYGEYEALRRMTEANQP